LQPYTVVAADALLEIGTAVMSAVFSLDEWKSVLEEKRSLVFYNEL
jgi:hypothetical protein